MSTLQDQLAEVRAARAQHYREHKVTEAVQATKDARVERERQESGGSSMSGSGSANGNGNGVAGLSRKRESRADSSDDEEIEWIEGPVSKKAAMGNGNGHVNAIASTSTLPPPATNPNPSFPSPSIRVTRTLGRHSGPLRKNTISFDEIVDRQRVKTGFVYSFFMGQDELFEYLPVGGNAGGRECPMYISRDMTQDAIAHQVASQLGLAYDPAKNLSDSTFDRIAAACAQAYEKMYGSNFRALYCRKAKQGCAHSKVGVLVYEGYLRIFITSANLMALDFEHGDNHWFIVDLPLLLKKTKSTSDFEQELLEHLTELGCPKSFINSIYGKYDYSSVKNVHIVASVPSSKQYTDDMATRYGCMRLREVVAPMTRGYRDVKMEICAGSVGGMQADWLHPMHHCFTGGGYKSIGKTDNDPPPYQITYPTRSDVEATRQMSQHGASQMGCHCKWPNASPEIKSMFRHYRSKDQAPDDLGGSGRGCLFHMKLYMAFSKDAEPITKPLWMYIGSANFSRAAWGQALPETGKKQQGRDLQKMNQVNNYELGIVVAGEEIEGMLEEGSVWTDVIPFERNGARYTGQEKPFNSQAWVK